MALPAWLRSSRNDLPIPGAARSDPKATEMLRMWSAKDGHHISIRTETWDDVGAWGIVLADLARHVADTYHEEEGIDRGQALRRVLSFMVRELAAGNKPGR